MSSRTSGSEILTDPHAHYLLISLVTTMLPAQESEHQSRLTIRSKRRRHSAVDAFLLSQGQVPNPVNGPLHQGMRPAEEPDRLTLVRRQDSQVLSDPHPAATRRPNLAVPPGRAARCPAGVG